MHGPLKVQFVSDLFVELCCRRTTRCYISHNIQASISTASILMMYFPSGGFPTFY